MYSPDFNVLGQADTAVSNLTQLELENQRAHLELSAHINYASSSVLAVQSSILVNDDDEGYFGEGTSGSSRITAQLEELAINRAKQLFGATYANVQPHSIEQANSTVLLALLNSGDLVLWMKPLYNEPLASSFLSSTAASEFGFVDYDVNLESGTLNYSSIQDIAQQCRPRLIICGCAAYPRTIDFEPFRAIADKVGAYLLADISHIADLVITDHYPNPIPYCDVITTTTDQTLRGPKGGIILTEDSNLHKKLCEYRFPGNQDTPLKSSIAGKAVALQEALQQDFVTYAEQTISNAQALATQLQNRGLKLISDGTNNHLLLVDLKSIALTIDKTQQLLNEININVDGGNISQDSQEPPVNHRHRLCLGTLAMTTRGLGAVDFTEVGNIIADRLLCPNDETLRQSCCQQVASLCERYPLYPHIRLQPPKI